LITLENIAVFPAPDQVQATEKPKKDNDGLHKRRGIWYFRAKVGGRVRDLSTKTRSYQAARKERQRRLQQLDEERALPDLANMTLEKASKLWLTEREKLVAKNTLRIDRERLRPLKDTFGNRKLSEMKAEEIRAYQLVRIEKVSPRTVNLEIKVLRNILRTAKLWSRIADDYKPLKENRKGPGRALTAEQEKKLFECAQKSLYWSAAYYAAIVAANTTMRGCELKGLQLRDVDLIERKLTIRRERTKTDAGCRVIPLNDTATWALAKLLERAQLLKAKEPEHFLFPGFRYKHTKEENAAGAGYDPTKPMVSWRSGWRTLTKSAGLEGLRFHDLRHHAITKLAEAGIADQTLMALAGHVSREMLEHYSHIRMAAKRTAVEALDKVKLPFVPKSNSPTDAEQPTVVG
jgi:integrase